MLWNLPICCFVGIFTQISQGHPAAQSFASKSFKWDKSHSELVYPQLHSPDSPRIKSSSPQSHSVLVLRTSLETFYIELKPNHGLFKTNTSDAENSSKPCHYHGNVLSHSDGVAAISMCEPKNRMSGTIIVRKDAFILRPLDHLEDAESRLKFHNFSKMGGIDPHVISKIDDTVTPFCGVDNSERFHNPEENEILYHRRFRRSNTEGDQRKAYKVIEAAIYVDYPLYHKFIVDRKKSLPELRDTILTIINQVQVIYNYKSLNQKFKIVVVKLEYLTKGEDAPDPVGGNIDEYLETFCAWQAPKNPSESSGNHWDHAIMLTGYDLYKEVNGKKNYKVLGLAWVNGMCRPKHSCTLEEGSSFEGSFVIAHEMGHSLGMMHDGVGNECDPTAYIMAEKTGPGRITWSNCSREYLEKFFRKGHGHCLEDDDSNSLENSPYKFDDQLPGHRFDLDDQCKLSLGRDYRPHVLPKVPFNNVCRQLWCISGLWASVAHPALEGSSCGGGRHCIQGKCKGERPNTSFHEGNSLVEVQKMLVDFLDRLKMAFQLLLP